MPKQIKSENKSGSEVCVSGILSLITANNVITGTKPINSAAILRRILAIFSCKRAGGIVELKSVLKVLEMLEGCIDSILSAQKSKVTHRIIFFIENWIEAYFCVTY